MPNAYLKSPPLPTFQPPTMDSDNDEPVQYGDANRAFLQAFMAQGSMTLKEAKPILAAIFTVQEGW